MDRLCPAAFLELACAAAGAGVVTAGFERVHAVIAVQIPPAACLAYESRVLFEHGKSIPIATGRPEMHPTVVAILAAARLGRTRGRP